MNSMPTAGLPPPTAPLQLSLDQQRVILRRLIARASNWWYWIAALTAFNAVAFFMHISWGFALGTGITDGVNGIVGVNPGLMPVAAVIDAVIVGLIALWGVLCGRGMVWAFWVGMALYAIDTILVLVFQQWISAAFHAYAIFNIYQGISPSKTLRRLEADQARANTAPYYAQQSPASPAIWPPPPGGDTDSGTQQSAE